MPEPKLNRITGGVTTDAPPVSSGLVGWFLSEQCRERMSYPLGYLSEDVQLDKVTDWPALIIRWGNIARGDGAQQKKASLELRVYLKDPRSESGDAELRQLCADIEAEINGAARGQLWGASDFRWESTKLLGIGNIVNVANSVFVATMNYTVLYVEKY